MKIEVCVDNIESALTAVKAGADRLELCGSLDVGGITPAYSLIKYVVKNLSVESYVMIRPRSGDFLFNRLEVQMMLEDIQIAKQLGANGVVIGALTSNAEIDLTVCRHLIQAANGMGITFHRAFDLCADPKQALEDLINLGCHRVLTSGQAINAFKGRKMLTELVKQAQGRISIMAGAGVNAENAVEIITTTGVNELHLSGKKYRNSQMKRISPVIMGNSIEDDLKIRITDFKKIKAIKQKLLSY
ncbi:copper homeostasis protein CutC [Mergibacter septicus]|uniref:PF03932 family protein CutC n=1 Tax=Mergibacter septicus TaxID=221402 RepID=A0A8E3MF08_9PAST|nr:copper homeostasis protein CutC [Mergibacter septicus]AWX14781.1 copper homeostasis protein CutC [Mergibacter septicus]QDJ14032.1 copper homeostasis protein CutC [Mergibacter septicus]UTU48520.1 copper homeostasis protein CutC [Mergibacter septicus]WMR95850.1 copper homeostasis protein CutC [Mergibacter septicus]